jgi:hypothetical protein
MVEKHVAVLHITSSILHSWRSFTTVVSLLVAINAVQLQKIGLNQLIDPGLCENYCGCKFSAMINVLHEINTLLSMELLHAI